MKYLVIRADSTTQIGVGHVMRCLALGQAWQDNGGKVVFISHFESSFLRIGITDEGFAWKDRYNLISGLVGGFFL